MGHGGRISWGRLIVGGLLALVVATALMVLFGPLVAMRIAGESMPRCHPNGVWTIQFTPCSTSG